jgi:hypothetical protein
MCYLRDDNEVDAERCGTSLRERSPITLDSAGRVCCATGVIQSIQFDPERAVGKRWCVEMDLWTGCVVRRPRPENAPANAVAGW